MGAHTVFAQGSMGPGILTASESLNELKNVLSDLEGVRANLAERRESIPAREVPETKRRLC